MPQASELDPSPEGPVRHRVSELTARLGGQLQGDDRCIVGLAPLDQAGPEHASFVSHGRSAGQWQACRAGVLIVKPEMADTAGHAGRSLILTDDPYLYFARLQQLLQPPQPPAPGVHASAVISDSAVIGPGCEIGPMVCIGHRARIGARCRLMAGVVIGDDVCIGDDTLLHPRVTVYAGAVLGRRLQVHSGTVIGAEGFGMAWDGQRWQRIPHTGSVHICDDVDIGANTTIDRGVLSHTVIERGVQIDNLVQIAHNVHIGAHSAIAACVGVAGSARIGARCRIGGAAMVLGHLEIADDTIISAGTLVPKSLREPGRYTAIYPLSTHREWKTTAAYTRQLSRLLDRIRGVERAFQLLASGLADPFACELGDDEPGGSMPH